MASLCYGPYKQDSTSTKRGLVLVQNQCARGRTIGTSGTMGRGVAESHNKSEVRGYTRTEERDIPTKQRSYVPTPLL